MKKLILVLAFWLCLSSGAGAVDFKMFDMRNKIFEGSKEIKALISTSSDAVALTSMFDACLVSITQLDAYFNMLGILETINKEDLSRPAVDFIISWLNEMKSSSDLSLKFIGGLAQPLEPKTREQIEKLKAYFKELNKLADAELYKLSLIRKTAKGGMSK
jgi:hypothetical protein